MISKDIVINKKSLNITWYQPEDMVFDGQTKTLTFSSGAGELINNDNLGSEYATADNLPIPTQEITLLPLLSKTDLKRNIKLLSAATIHMRYCPVLSKQSGLSAITSTTDRIKDLP